MRKKPVVPKNFAVTPEQLYWLRGMLMAKLRKNITVLEFADYLGISRRQMWYLFSGGRKPGKRTFDGILGLRKYGIMIHMSDFEAKRAP